MSLISENIEIGIVGCNVSYYENLGYEIPKYKNKNGMVVKRGTKINVKISDLQKNSVVKVKVKCDECGKEYEIVYRDYNKCRHNEKTYCHKCAMIVLNTGENNYLWNSNMTLEEREFKRCYPEYTLFIKKVLNRDKFTCQCCGKTNSSDMEAHHLDGYNNFPNKRTDETNGITLCKTCHNNFHSLYGKGNNTKEQFEEWIIETIELLKYEEKLYTCRKIYCIEENKIYDSAEMLANEWNVYKSNVYYICNKKVRKNGYIQKTIKNKHILWLDEFKSMSQNDIKTYLDNYVNGVHKKYRYLYDENFSLLKEGITKVIAEWLVNNKYIKSISTANSIIKNKINNEKPYYSTNNKTGFYFRDYPI